MHGLLQCVFAKKEEACVQSRGQSMLGFAFCAAQVPEDPGLIDACLQSRDQSMLGFAPCAAQVPEDPGLIDEQGRKEMAAKVRH